MRTIIELTNEQIAALRALCDRRGISRAEAIRQAVDRLVDDESTAAGARETAFREAFGTWKHDQRDALDIVAELRSEWDHRP